MNLLYHLPMDEASTASKSLAVSSPLQRPSTGADLAACVAWARDRDPWGHRVHVLAATVGCGLLTIATAPATIALFGLVGWSIARSWVLWPLWLRLLRHPLVVLVLAFFVWSALSLTWSANAAEGLETLRAQRYLLLIPSLVPVLGAVRWLLLGVLAGVMVQTVAQVLVFCGLVPWSMRGAWSMNGGISKHTGPTGAWAVVAVGITLSPALGLVAIGRAGTLVASVVSLIMTASRSGILGLALFSGLLLVTVRGRKAWHVRVGVLGAAGAVALAIGVGQFKGATYVYEGAIYAWRAVTGRSVRDNSIGIRYVMTKAAWQVGTAKPWTGVGLGAGRIAVLQEPVLQAFLAKTTNAKFKDWETSGNDLHGGWSESFAELGVPGFLLFILPVLIALWYAIRHTRSRAPPEHAWGPALLAAVLTWLAFGMFNVVYSSGQLEALAMLTLTLAIGARASLFETDTGMHRTNGARQDEAHT